MSQGLEMTVLVSEGARRRHLPLYSEIVRRAHKRGLAGASVFRGVEGFGDAHQVHQERVIDVPAHLPLVIVVVDIDARVREFAEEISDLVGDAGVVTLRAVEVLSHAGGRR